MTNEKKLYRSRDALIGGVCAGVAEYFNFDPVIARILAIALALSTAGLVAVAYVALWAVLPLAPATAGPVEVKPQFVHSDTYGQVAYTPPADSSASAARAAAEAMGAAPSYEPANSYVGTGHVPPEPPAAVAAAWAQQAAPGTPAPAWVPPSWEAPHWQPPAPDSEPMAGTSSPTAAPPTSPATASAPQQAPATSAASPVFFAAAPAPSVTAPPPAPSSMPPVPPPMPAQASAPAAPTPNTPARVDRSRGLSIAIFLGSLLLFFGLATLLADGMEGVLWWQFWPLVFAIMGIASMVVPGEPGQRMNQFVSGFMLFCLGCTLLFVSTGVVGLSTLASMFTALWPLLLVMTGLFILGAALRAPWCTLLAGLCFAAFCVVGIGWFSTPGILDIVVLHLPFGRELIFPLEVLHGAH